jgi:hypothetical protein
VAARTFETDQSGHRVILWKTSHRLLKENNAMTANTTYRPCRVPARPTGDRVAGSAARLLTSANPADDSARHLVDPFSDQ